MRIGCDIIGIETSWVALAVGVTRCAVRHARRVLAAAGAGWRSTVLVTSSADGTCVDAETELRPTSVAEPARLARRVLQIAVIAMVRVVRKVEHHVADVLRCLVLGRPGRLYKRQSWSSIWQYGVTPI